MAAVASQTVWTMPGTPGYLMDVSPDIATRTSSTRSTPLDAHIKRMRDDEELDALLAEPPSKRMELTPCHTPAGSPASFMHRMLPYTRLPSNAFGTPISGHPICCPLAAELRIRWGAAESKGPRSSMEDRTVCKLEDNLTPHGFFAVFDGHGGSETADYCAEQLHRNVLESQHFPDFVPALQDGFLRTDASFLAWAASRSRKTKESNTGAAAVSVIVTAHHLTLAHAGDCRAILVKRTGSAHSFVELTTDHAADPSINPNEVARVKRAGACTEPGYVCVGDNNLPMTRAFGNLRLKVALGRDWLREPQNAQVVTALPEVRIHTRSADDRAVVIASDGLFGEVLSSAQVAEFALVALEANAHTGDAEGIAARRMVEAAFTHGSSDNVSVVVISLQPPETHNSFSGAEAHSSFPTIPDLGHGLEHAAQWHSGASLAPPGIEHVTSQQSVTTQGFSPGRPTVLDKLHIPFAAAYPAETASLLRRTSSEPMM